MAVIRHVVRGGVWLRLFEQAPPPHFSLKVVHKKGMYYHELTATYTSPFSKVDVSIGEKERNINRDPAGNRIQDLLNISGRS